MILSFHIFLGLWYYSCLVQTSLVYHQLILCYKIICNTVTPQLKGICCDLNVMHHIPRSPGVLQLPWCAATFTGIGYNFPSECIYLCYNFQWYVCCKNTRVIWCQHHKPLLPIKHNILILIVGLSWGASIRFTNVFYWRTIVFIL